jgi:hypothetical protein
VGRGYLIIWLCKLRVVVRSDQACSRRPGWRQNWKLREPGRAETKRLQDEGTRKAAEEAAGQERLKDVRENQSWLEQYGPLVGYPLGFQSALGETAPLNGKAQSRGGR